MKKMFVTKTLIGIIVSALILTSLMSTVTSDDDKNSEDAAVRVKVFDGIYGEVTERFLQEEEAFLLLLLQQAKAKIKFRY